VLVAWGQSSDRLIIGFGLGMLLLLAYFLPYKFSPSDKIRSRVNDLTFIIILFGAVWYYFQRQALQTNLALHLLSICPIFLFPKILFNAFLDSQSSSAPPQSRDGVAIARQWLSTEFSFSRQHLDKRRAVPFEYIYYFLTLFIACFSLPWIAGLPTMIFGLIAFALCVPWKTSIKSIPWTATSVLFALAGGFLGGLTIEKTQDFAEEYLAHMWSRRATSTASADSTDTAIGRRGQINNGNQLIARLDWSLGHGYIRNGLFSYTANGSSWFASPPGANADQSIYPSEGNTFTLTLSKEITSRVANISQARISMNFPRDKTALPLPIGSSEIFGLPLNKLDINRMGIPVASGSPGFARFGLTFYSAHDPQPKPNSADLYVPPSLIETIDAFLDAAHARGKTAPESAAAISSYFRTQWKYTLNLETPDGSPRSLSRFLLSDRQGHCEYFASATTLAMRRLGFPSRYSTGFLVNEFDEQEKLFWIRARDAHAWSSYWNGSSWHTLDSTPGSPSDEDSWSSKGFDWLSRLQYLLDEFDGAGLAAKIETLYLWIMLGIFGLYVGYKLRLAKNNTLPSFEKQTVLLTKRITKITGESKLATETSFDYWRRMATRLENATELMRLADQREHALFKSPRDILKSNLIDCELLAQKLRKRIKVLRK
jgi:transglutaminase-like putative cysteine protease